jgi:hypothetical protein
LVDLLPTAQAVSESETNKIFHLHRVFADQRNKTSAQTPERIRVLESRSARAPNAGDVEHVVEPE